MWPFTGKGSRGDLADSILALEVRMARLEERFGDFVKKQALRAARSAKDGHMMEELLTAARGAPTQPNEAELLRRAFPDGR